MTPGMSTELGPIKAYNFSTCKDDSYSTDIIETSFGGTIESVTHDVVLVTVDLKTSNFSEYSSIYTENPLNDTANIWFCIFAGIGKVTHTTNDTIGKASISYVKLKFDLTVNLAVGFSSVDIDVDEIEAASARSEETLEYTVTAYECDAGTQICYDAPETKTQNSVLDICIFTNTTDADIRDIKELTLSQSHGIAYRAISDFNATSAITVKSTIDTKMEMVST